MTSHDDEEFFIEFLDPDGESNFPVRKVDQNPSMIAFWQTDKQTGG